MKVAIIGAGVSGITAAYCLSKHNLTVDVFESSSTVGGLAASIEVWNQTVDIGPHRFFSSDKKINELWLEVVGDEYEMVNRLTRIYYKGKFFNYPLTLKNTLRGLGTFESSACAFSYLQEKISKRTLDNSFESWVQAKFGKRLYNTFFKDYTEKLWGIPCSELDSDFAAQRIKKLSLKEALINAVKNGKDNKHRTLVEQFAYPKGGTGMVYRKMADFVLSKGNNVHLNTPVSKIINVHDKVIGIELEDGQFKEYDHVISTMPLTTMINRLPYVPLSIKELAGKLSFRNTIVVYLLIDSINLFPDNWIYVHSPELLMGRITNFRNWVPDLYKEEDKTVVAIEYWCDQQSEIWSFLDKDLINLASKELVRTNLTTHDMIKDGIVYRINKSYPMYQKDYKDILMPIQAFLSSQKNVSVIGRYGAFKYNNQDHSILMGMLAAENITHDANHNLWNINSDYETFQESYKITATGLSKQ